MHTEIDWGLPQRRNIPTRRFTQIRETDHPLPTEAPDIYGSWLLAVLQGSALPPKAVLLLLVPGPSCWQPQRMVRASQDSWAGPGHMRVLERGQVPRAFPARSPPSVALSCIPLPCALSSSPCHSSLREPLSAIANLPSSLETLAPSLPSPPSWPSC